MSRNALAEADDFGFPLCRILSGFWVKVFRFSSTFQRGDVPTALQSLLNEGFAHANIDLSTTNEVIEASVEPKVLEPKAKKLIRWQRPPRHPHSLGTRIHCVAMAKAKPKREQ